MYKVVKARLSEAPNPIRLVKNEIVKCIESSDEDGAWAGWIYCKGDQKEGWVPKQIIEHMVDEGRILEDYDATEFDLNVGDIIISEKLQNGWIYGAKTEDAGVKAWAPLNHLEKMEEL